MVSFCEVMTSQRSMKIQSTYISTDGRLKEILQTRVTDEQLEIEKGVQFES